MKRILILLFILATTIYFYGENIIKIAAAANLTSVLDEIKTNYQKENPDIKIEITYGASGKLTAQIIEGAPFDIFMSADMQFPQKIYDSGFAVSKPVIYAKGSLIIFTIKNIDLKNVMNILTDNNIKSIAIANPETAPYGKASIQALDKLGILKNIENKLVKAESISQVIQMTINAADIGFTAKSLVIQDNMIKYKQNINWIDVEPKLYSPIEQGMIIIKNTNKLTESKRFYNYILSNKCKTIFIKYGYIF